MAKIEEALVPRRSRKGCWIVASIFAALLIGAAAFYGPFIVALWKRGFFDPAPNKHAYSATSEQNLKAIYQGMKLYQESEGQYPFAEGWMDAIENRISTNDLKKGEAQKKLIRPDLLTRPGEFGYAMNDLASGKYSGDVPKPSETPLIYESKQSGRNA
ncbi:MAG: hypothetical protein IT203_02770, partial [Fimbriimonadaceae bacterium]|nr:hypothetical protein [Fimbriimonadaceae bacterium]